MDDPWTRGNDCCARDRARVKSVSRVSAILTLLLAVAFGWTLDCGGAAHVNQNPSFALALLAWQTTEKPSILMNDTILRTDPLRRPPSQPRKVI